MLVFSLSLEVPVLSTRETARCCWGGRGVAVATSILWRDTTGGNISAKYLKIVFGKYDSAPACWRLCPALTWPEPARPAGNIRIPTEQRWGLNCWQTGSLKGLNSALELASLRALDIRSTWWRGAGSRGGRLTSPRLCWRGTQSGRHTNLIGPG